MLTPAATDRASHWSADKTPPPPVFQRAECQSHPTSTPSDEKIDRGMTLQLQRAIDLTESRIRWYRLTISVQTVLRRGDAALSCGEQDR
jgi:hypothetical protein